MKRYRLKITYEILKKLLNIPEEHIIIDLQHIGRENSGFVDIAGGNIDHVEGAVSMIDYNMHNFNAESHERPLIAKLFEEIEENYSLGYKLDHWRELKKKYLGDTK